MGYHMAKFACRLISREAAKQARVNSPRRWQPKDIDLAIREAEGWSHADPNKANPRVRRLAAELHL